MIQRPMSVSPTSSAALRSGVLPRCFAWRCVRRPGVTSARPTSMAVRNRLQAPLPHEKTRFMGDFKRVLVALNQSDPRIVWPEADMDWLGAQLDAPHGPAIMALLLACGNAPDRAISLRDLAALTGEPESAWRERCQRGDVPGAGKDRGGWSVSSEALIRFVLPSAQAQRPDRLLAQQQEEAPGEDNGASDARNTVLATPDRHASPGICLARRKR